MPFGTITVNSATYDPRQPGHYSKTDVTFGAPPNEFRVRGATQSKDGVLRGSVTRLLEKDASVGDDTVRKQCVVTITVATPSADFTSSEIDGMISDISEFLTPNTLSRVLQGES